MFPLAFDVAADALERSAALAGGMLQAISHAMAKAAMFMAAGLIYQVVGHDRIAELAGAGRAAPMSVLTFALAGLALMGLPSSGAYSAKKLLLDAAEPVKTRAPVSRLAETAALALANPARRAAIAVGGTFVRTDGVLRQWPGGARGDRGRDRLPRGAARARLRAKYHG